MMLMMSNSDKTIRFVGILAIIATITNTIAMASNRSMEWCITIFYGNNIALFNIRWTTYAPNQIVIDCGLITDQPPITIIRTWLWHQPTNQSNKNNNSSMNGPNSWFKLVLIVQNTRIVHKTKLWESQTYWNRQKFANFVLKKVNEKEHFTLSRNWTSK